MLRKRANVVGIMVALALCATSASAVDARKITSYWGYYLSGGGTACYVLVGPPIPPEIIGQKIRECDGTTWTWGNTSCTYFAPTVEYEECGASSGNKKGLTSASADSRAATPSVKPKGR